MNPEQFWIDYLKEEVPHWLDFCLDALAGFPEVPHDLMILAILPCDDLTWSTINLQKENGHEIRIRINGAHPIALREIPQKSNHREPYPKPIDDLIRQFLESTLADLDPEPLILLALKPAANHHRQILPASHAEGPDIQIQIDGARQLAIADTPQTLDDLPTCPRCGHYLDLYDRCARCDPTLRS